MLLCNLKLLRNNTQFFPSISPLVKKIPTGIRCMVNLTKAPAETLIVGAHSGTLTKFVGENPTELIDTDQISTGSGISSLSPSTPQDELLAVTKTGSFLRVRSKNLDYTCHSQNPAAGMRKVAFPFGSADKILSCSEDTTMTLWDLNDYSAMVVCQERASSIPDCCVGSADIIVAGYECGRIKAFDAIQGGIFIFSPPLG